jgi:dihydrodipicolinate synthase/N-acetylneuraminate lyase
MAKDRKAILDFFKGVMDRSPLPVMIYNFPYVSPSSLSPSPHLSCFIHKHRLQFERTLID